MNRPRSTALLATLTIVLAATARRGDDEEAPAQEACFTYPCEDYVKGLRGAGNFGVRVDGKGTPFSQTWHLAEDVWLAGGTKVHAIADGVVCYSAFSPTWTDDEGFIHWNLGNVVVIEHPLDPPIDELSSISSFYVHLAADRRVEVGDEVRCGDIVGRIGKHRSEENGRYPAHLHFGIHRGPYVQIPPALDRELRAAAASEEGLRFGDIVIRGAIEIVRHGESDVLIRGEGEGQVAILSLLVQSTAPENRPPDIMGWCQGYGDRDMVDEWIRPSTFLEAKVAK